MISFTKIFIKNMFVVFVFINIEYFLDSFKVFEYLHDAITYKWEIFRQFRFKSNVRM